MKRQRIEKHESLLHRVINDYIIKKGKSFLNNNGFEVGTIEYKSCVMNKGQNNE